MYHDEFARRKPAPISLDVEDALGGLAFQVGGGLTLGLLASFDRHLSTALFLLGGLVPLLACSIGILAHRCSEVLALLTDPDRAEGRRPVPALANAHSRPIAGLRGPLLRLARPRAIRAGFDRSRDLG